MNEEIKSALEALKTTLEGKSKEQAQAEIKAFEEKYKETVKAEAKSLFDAEIEKVKKELKTAYTADIKVVQDHADRLSAKLNKPGMQGKNEVKTMQDQIAEKIEEKHDDLQKFIRKEIKSFDMELKVVGDMSTANVTGGTRYGELYRTGIIQNPNRKVHMDQILPGGSIGPGNSFTFMRENGDGEGAIAPVSEGALKPQIDLDLVETTVQIETIAAWLRISRKAMTNIPGMVSFLQSRLPEKFRRVLDAQILYGNGVTPQLDGILNTGNFQASTAAATAPLIEKIITDVSVLEDTYERDANGILLRPADYYSFFLNKASGSGEYDLPQGITFVNGQMYLFGIPVWASTAITAPDYVVGDFQNGAQLLTQEAMRLEFFEQDGINVRENKVTVRIEGNYALPVYGDDYFIKGDATVTT